MTRRRREPSSSAELGSDTNIPPSVWAGLDEWNTGLDVPAERLRKHLRIPDICSRSGLKKIHTDFDRYNKRLNECYDIALREKDTGGTALVYVIWSKMAADAILREQLLRAGLIGRIIPLLAMPSAGDIAEELMKRFIWHADGANTEEFALEIFRHNLDIVKIMQEHPNSVRVVDCCIRALAHGLLHTILRHSASHPSVFDDPSLVPALSALLDTLRRSPNLLPNDTLHVAMIILARVPPLCPERCRLKEVPSLLAYYAALSRSHHLRRRCNAVMTVRQLARFAQPVRGPDENVQLIVTRSRKRARRAYASQDDLFSILPEDLRSLLVGYSVGSCESVVDFKCSSDATSVFSQFYRDDDLCALGLRLAELVQLSEFSINPDADLDITHRRTTDDSKQKQLDHLPLCAAALAKRGASADLDAADTLRLHYLLATRADPKQIYLHAQHAKERSPSHAYAHYAYAMSFSLSPADMVLRLRALAAAAACAGQAALLQRQLFAQAVKTAADGAFCTMHGLVDISPEPARLAARHFRLAVDAANVYLQIAPPDTRQRAAVLSWYAILKLVADAPRARDDLLQYEPLLETIRTAERFVKILHRDQSPAKTDIQLTQEWLFEQYRSGSIRQWDGLIQRLRTMDDDVSELINAPPPAFAFTSVTANKARLDQCAWCKNSTVSVKKCSRCGEAYYCSTTCQRADWPRHKASCRSSAPA